MTLAHVAVVIENPPTTGESGIRFLAATDQCGQSVGRGEKAERSYSSVRMSADQNRRRAGGLRRTTTCLMTFVTTAARVDAVIIEA